MDIFWALLHCILRRVHRVFGREVDGAGQTNVSEGKTSSYQVVFLQVNSVICSASRPGSVANGIRGVVKLEDG